MVVMLSEQVLADDLRDTYLGVARALVRGDLPEKDVALFKSSEMWSLISRLAEGIRKAGPERSIKDLRSIVDVNVPKQTEKQHWGELNRTANFLKHADVDHDRSLAAHEINFEELIFGGCRLYMDLMGHLTPEMEVWTTYEFVKHGIVLTGDDPWADIAEAFQAISPERRKAAGTRLIEIQRKYSQPPQGAAE